MSPVGLGFEHTDRHKSMAAIIVAGGAGTGKTTLVKRIIGDGKVTGVWSVTTKYYTADVPVHVARSPSDARCLPCLDCEDPESTGVGAFILVLDLTKVISRFLRVLLD